MRKVRLIKGYARLNEKEARRFVKGGTYTGECGDCDPVIEQTWSIEEDDEAKEALAKVRSTYEWVSDQTLEVAEYALEYFDEDENGDFASGSDFQPAEIMIDLYVADHHGNFMEKVESIEEGIDVIKKFEADDRDMDAYEEDFYEIIDAFRHTVYSRYYGIDERPRKTSDAQKRATEKWQKENYEFIKVRLNKGEKEIIKAKADAEGKSINQYIRDRIL